MVVPDSRPVFPPGRYGRRREPRPRRTAVVALLASLVVIAGVAIGVRMYRQYGQPAYTPRVVRFTPDGETAITVTIEVHKRGGGRAVCHLRALRYDGGLVAEEDVPVPAGRTVTVTHRLATSERPHAVRVPNCHAPD